MIAVQYDFFQSREQSEIAALRKEMNKVKTSADNVRKALFARNNELQKKSLELEERLKIIERNICVGV